MQTLYYVSIGALMWATAIGLLTGTFVGFLCFLGPPASNRADTFAMIAGGACLLLVTAIVVGVTVTIVMNVRSA